MLRRLRRAVTPRTLFGRAVPSIVVPMVLLQILLSYIFYNRVLDNVTGWLSEGVAGEVALLVEELESDPNAQRRAAVIDRFQRHTELGLYLQPSGRLADAVAKADIEHDGVNHIDSKILDGFQDKLKHPFAVDLDPADTSHVVVYVQLPDGLLHVNVNRKRLTSTTAWLLLTWMIGGALVLAVLSVSFLRLQVRPLRRLARAADSFGKGRDAGDVRLQGSLEIRQAAHAFNLMRHRLLRHMSQRTELLAAVSHDLRTPLTRMRLGLELVAPESDPGIADLRTDVEEMTQLVDTYLAFARGEGREAVEPTALKPILDGMRDRAERSGVELEIAMEKPLIMPLRPLAFRRCLANLVDNACRYGRWIGITVKKRDEFVEIAVEDDGPGIPDSFRDKVLEPFFRLEQREVHCPAGGTGLGLTIARDVVLGHGGDLKLDRSSRGGLKALLRLPA